MSELYTSRTLLEVRAEKNIWLVLELLKSYRHHLLRDESYHFLKGFGMVLGWFWDGLRWLVALSDLRL